MQTEKTNYSYETSLPAYKLVKVTTKEKQSEKIISVIKKGADCLLKISEWTGILQSTVAARINDLIKEGKVNYEGKLVYNGMKRKKITLVKVDSSNYLQPELF